MAFAPTAPHQRHRHAIEDFVGGSAQGARHFVGDGGAKGAEHAAEVAHAAVELALAEQAREISLPMLRRIAAKGTLGAVGLPLGEQGRTSLSLSSGFLPGRVGLWGA
jgi:hypothetical protein